MTLGAGKTLSFYEILGPLGAGGMGEVWRARDTRLGREVALKVLPDELADDEELLKRFEREAKTLAALNHANVAQVFGIDQVDGTCFIAMELVSGEDLSERLRRGPLPLAEALDVCRQIADGLEAAHEAGVVHRDLKPANVRITPDGKVKVLDFGLARAAGPGGASSGAGSGSDDALSTEAGRLLGTPAYMAPEQVRGRPVDRRADVFAFGCVFYECLTGRNAFPGETVGDVLAAVLEREPDLSALPRSTPSALRHVLTRCLRKDARERMRDIGDVRLLLAEAAEGRSDDASEAEIARLRRSRTAVLAAGALAVAAFVAWRAFGPELGVPEQAATRWTLDLPDGAELGWRGTSANLSKLGRGSPLLSISADGRRVAYCMDKDDASEIRVHDLGADFNASPIAGTADGRAPFLSPDGEWLGFFADDAMQIVHVEKGGSPQPVIALSSPNFAACWTPDGGSIVYTTSTGLWRVQRNGAGAERLAEPRRDRGEVELTSPAVPPDGAGVLFTVSTGRRAHVEYLSFADGERKLVVSEGTNAHLLPDGRLIYAQDGGIRVLEGFDPRAGGVAPVSEPVLEEVYTTPSPGGIVLAHYAVSDTGTLVFAPASAQPTTSTVRWVDADGSAQRIFEEDGFCEHMRLSPDRTRFACDILDERGAKDVFLFDLARRSLDPVTTDGTSVMSAWSPDELLSIRSTIRQDVIRDVAPTGEPVAEIPPIPVDGPGAGPGAPVFADCWSPDGEMLYLTRKGAGGRSLWSYARGAEHPVRITEDAEDARYSAISPDGRWLAYTATERGRSEVFLRPVPDLAPRLKVSSAGGGEPLWSADGATIYLRRRATLLAVPFDAATARLGAARELLGDDAPYDWEPEGHHHYDLDRVNGRFLMVEHHGEAPRRIRVVLNWTRELDPPR